jgi:hypothetical protein
MGHVSYFECHVHDEHRMLPRSLFFSPIQRRHGMPRPSPPSLKKSIKHCDLWTISFRTTFFLFSSRFPLQPIMLFFVLPLVLAVLVQALPMPPPKQVCMSCDYARVDYD